MKPAIFALLGIFLSYCSQPEPASLRSDGGASADAVKCDDEYALHDDACPHEEQDDLVFKSERNSSNSSSDGGTDEGTSTGTTDGNGETDGMSDGSGSGSSDGSDGMADGGGSDGDSNVVEFRIAAGTDDQPWNSAGNPIRATVGQEIHFINDDTITHRLHTGGAPCPHGPNFQPGETFVCVVSQAFSGDNTWDHIAGDTARVYIVTTDD